MRVIGVLCLSLIYPRVVSYDSRQRFPLHCVQRGLQNAGGTLGSGGVRCGDPGVRVCVCVKRVAKSVGQATGKT